jgi:hypothetical protein
MVMRGMMRLGRRKKECRGDDGKGLREVLAIFAYPYRTD